MAIPTSKSTVKELREALTSRGLDSSGVKNVLVERLEAAIAEDAKKLALKGKRKNDNDSNGDNAPKAKVAKTDKSWEDMSAAELKAALAEKGLSVSGAKKALIDRLKEADSATNDAVASTSKDDEDEEDKVMVTKIKKGVAVLDSFVPDSVKLKAHVLAQGNDIYDATLNQTNVGNNNNKFYIIQALEEGKGKYYVFTRWGRVGVPGQTQLFNCSTKEEAINIFSQKYKDKTGSYWADRANFVARHGKYTLIEMDYGGSVEDDVKKLEEVEAKGKSPMKAGGAKLESKLDRRVKELIELICDVAMMNEQMMEIGYDAKKMPLGKLSKSTILRGYEVLKRIAAVIEGTSRESLVDLSSEFYTVIPHDFGFKKMRDFVIKTPQELKKKLDMVEALGEIEIASKILEGPKSDLSEHPADTHYRNLSCELQPLEDSSSEVTMMKEYVENTHAKTHSGYSLSVEQVFKVNRAGEQERFKEAEKIPNHMLLWHGSRLTNWTGILSQGLRIAPPEAPVTGYMFGKGVYFADMVSKSANYCFTSPSNNTGLLLLCEVALGDMQELTTSNYHADKLPPGKNSTKGVGATEPDMSKSVTLPNGTVVPLAKPLDTSKGNALLYNEYIVYDVSQIRMQYLLKVKFNYGNKLY